MNTRKKRYGKKVIKGNVSLIVPSACDIGARYISAALKENEFSSSVISMNTLNKRLSLRELKALSKSVEGSMLIGISVILYGLDKSRQITRYLKKINPNAPIVWGGIHPSTCPEACIKENDIIFIGDAEKQFLLLAKLMEKGMDIKTAAEKLDNFWIRKDDGKIIRLPNKKQSENLDIIPTLDTNTVFPLHGLKSLRQAPSYLREILRNTLWNSPLKDTGKDIKSNVPLIHMTSRGCKGACTYCGHPAYRKSTNNSILRKQSVKKAITELKELKKKMDYNVLVLVDADFLERDLNELKIFSRLYKKEIDVPFRAYASPESIDEKKIETLIEMGLVEITVGIQTGSDRIGKKIYRRKADKKTINKAAFILKKYTDKIIVKYDLITNNPHETLKDIKDSIDLVLSLPTPFNLQVYNLCIFPGTDFFSSATQKFGQNATDWVLIHSMFRTPGNYKKRKSASPSMNILLHAMHGNHDGKKAGLLKRKTVIKTVNSDIRKRLDKMPRLMTIINKSLRWIHAGTSFKEAILLSRKPGSLSCKSLFSEDDDCCQDS